MRSWKTLKRAPEPASVEAQADEAVEAQADEAPLPGELTGEGLADDLISRAKRTKEIIKERERAAKTDPERDPLKPEPKPPYVSDVGVI